MKGRKSNLTKRRVESVLRKRKMTEAWSSANILTDISFVRKKNGKKEKKKMKGGTPYHTQVTEF